MAARSARRASADGFTAGLSAGRSFAIAQNYQFNSNPAYRYGAQAFDGVFIGEKRFNPRWSLLALGGGGATVLGAVDSIPLSGIAPEEPPPDAGQGVSTGPRYYDYGPGGNLLATFILRRDNAQIVNFGYELHHLHSIDGVRANHLLQRARRGFHVSVARGVGSWRVD